MKTWPFWMLMLYILMTELSSLQLTGAHVVISGGASHATSPNPSIQWRLTQGQASAIVAEQCCVSLKGKWMPHCSFPFKILTASFFRRNFPDGHHLVQDNALKHCSKLARKFYEEDGINWCPTPPESSDLNLIEKLVARTQGVYQKRSQAHIKECIDCRNPGFLGNCYCWEMHKVHWPLEKAVTRSHSMRRSCNQTLQDHLFTITICMLIAITCVHIILLKLLLLFCMYGSSLIVTLMSS